ncbi:related to SWA2-Clathrin-binding protein required for normal clathrin function and for uncoating of clathrin-coated vesicles [Serendipita indica DSM 11827]|uniref:Related to SWA2-Clathrin-binding protein required for normal clathrin function and for uncoating of clathrin-coated vesicles n=1 Tax=Serendipita indica (strain DSM 11827) TaxID=1109443 RepID=G4TIJ2_SERID|nr:related to SWA2-Clathrin-binding protein required for normal clathrin function and for uncoating of clathrin-coated vesicles [Serendipita indica DSM 11827]
MDAFAGLAWDEPKAGNKNTTLGAQQTRQLTPSQFSQSSSTNDVFGRLAAAGQPAAVPKPANGIGSHINIPSRNVSTPQMANSSGGDPFSGLFARGGSPNINMSMADRRAHAEREKRDKERREREKVEAQGAMWDQFENTFSTGNSNVNSRTASPSPAILAARSHGVSTPPIGLKTNPGVAKVAASPPSGTDLFWSMHHSPQAGSSRTGSPAILPQRPGTGSRQHSGQSLDALATATQTNDTWSQLDALAAPKPSPAVRSPPSALDPFDVDLLSGTSSSQPLATPPISRTRSPGDFDFNERDDGAVSEDDILGDLAKPVIRSDTPDLSRKSIGSPAKSKPSRASSPPPHIIGQIVEMGFTPEQARNALAATDTGVDVEVALESLLAAAGSGDITSPSPYTDSHPPPPRNRTAPREQPPPRASGTSTPTGNSNSNILSGQIQADKLLAQASEIGFSMFTRANAFWNQGKEVVQKAYEETRKTTLNAGPPAPSDGRPRWMANAPVEDEGADPTTPRRAAAPSGGGFKDDDDLPEEMPLPRQKAPPKAAAPAPAAQPRSASLFDDGEETYVSPHRRRAAPAAASSRADTVQTSARAPNYPSRQAQQPQRQQTQERKRPPLVIPDTSPSAYAQCTSFRTKGTEFFKLGQYGEAESCYTRAITSLPDTHILLTSLYTNRAAARLKTGDSGGAAADCLSALKLLGVSEDLSGLMDVDDRPSLQFDGVPGKLDLREQAVKALQRRAAGLEAMERWDRARAVWERLAGLSWTQAQGRVKDEATRSAGRCRTMVSGATAAPSTSGPSSSQTPAKPRPRPAPRPAVTSAVSSKPSEASQRLRALDAAQEAEENVKIQLKDSVDARIQAWKGGKEANVRALIASLETVLWPELNWQKVGMHELVTPSQVKIRYTKAIAKVHPDKLKTGNTTTEQRMIANGVFAGLNEAWGSFKQ